LCVGACLLWTVPAYAAEPTLARLSFWVPPERMEEFAAVYQDSISPTLKRDGLAESLVPVRATDVTLWAEGH
jgi:hypothetical protein